MQQDDPMIDFYLKQYKPPLEPRYVFLFSGHMIDAPGREPPRFPDKKEKAADEAIRSALDGMGAGPTDIGLCGGACGGDLLFAEACLDKGMHVELRIPFDEPTFLKNSVLFAPGNWRIRFEEVKKRKNDKNESLTRLFIMPDELGPTPSNVNPYERSNLWQLYTALSLGPEKVWFICLWDGKGGDGPGGTKHMHDEVLKRSGRDHVHVIDPAGLREENN